MNLSESGWVERMMVWNKERRFWFEEIGRSSKESFLVERRMVWKERSVEVEAFRLMMVYHQSRTWLAERVKRWNKDY